MTPTPTRPAPPLSPAGMCGAAEAGRDAARPPRFGWRAGTRGLCMLCLVMSFTFEGVLWVSVKTLPSTELTRSLTLPSTGRSCCIFWKKKKMHALSQLHSGADGGATGGGFDESAVRLRRGVTQRRPARDQGVCRSGDENLSTRGAQGPGRVSPVGTAARGSLAQSLRRLCGTRALRTRADCTSRRGRPRSRTRHARTRAHTHVPRRRARE